jgi:hypothetical protein
VGSDGGQQAELKINQKIILWTKGRLGKKVGRGQCWDLAEESLQQAGAQTSKDLGPVGEDTDYIWGDEIESLKDVTRGDILQIRNHLTKTTTITKYVFADGSTVTRTEERTAKRGHHTAIVRSKPDVNGSLKTYEQHVNGRDVVKRMTLHTSSVGTQTSKSKGMHQHPRTKKYGPVSITRTVTIEVTGKIWAYRPKPR